MGIYISSLLMGMGRTGFVVDALSTHCVMNACELPLDVLEDWRRLRKVCLFSGDKLETRALVSR
eukprot:11087733-Ditylum_brightwellii.AAC.1